MLLVFEEIQIEVKTKKMVSLYRLKLSIIIPAYNEENRIGCTLDGYLEFFRKKIGNDFEIIVVLNGCRDDTRGVVDKIASNSPELKVLEFKERIGKGGGIKEGFKVARGQIVSFVDADGATSPRMLYTLFMILSQLPNLDCVIGSRWLPGAVLNGLSQRRRVLSRGYNFIVNLMFNLGFKDTQCGGKVLRREILPKMMDDLTLSDMSFDVNLLYEIKKHRGNILEVPIEWNHDTYSTVRIFKSSVGMLLSLFRLRILNSPLKGTYPFLHDMAAPIRRWLGY